MNINKTEEINKNIEKNLNFKTMPKQSSNQQVLIKVSGSTIHKISKISRTKIAEGSCYIYEQAGSHYLKVKTIIYNLKDLVFGEIKYDRSISYFFKGEQQVGLVYVLSIMTDINKPQLLKEFRDVLSKYSPVQDLATQAPGSELLQRMHDAYPEFLTQQVKSKNVFVVVSKQLGSIIGAVSGMVSKPTESSQDMSEKQSQMMTENQQSVNNDGKWNKVNKKVSSNIGHKFNHSNNSIIKAVRDISAQTKNALNEGYYEANAKKAKSSTKQQETVMQMKPKQKVQQK